MQQNNPLLALVARICEPNPKILKDPSEYSTVFNKNKTFFWVLFVMAFTPLFFLKFSTMSQEAANMMLIVFTINFILFSFLCRSYLWIFHLYFTLGASFGSIPIMNLEKDMVLSYNGAALIMPLLVFVLTNNFYCMGFAGVAQVGIMATIFKKIFKEKLINTDADTLANKFASSNIFFIIFMMISFTIVFVMLKNKTEALAHANKVTQETLEHQKTFIFSFSHELRNPINCLLGNLQLLFMIHGISSEAKNLARVSQICGELLLQLINNVLDAGKQDIGNLEVNLTTTKIHDVFQRIWVICSELIARKNLQSVLKMEKKVPPLMLLDGHRINQIMMNLIGNAIKFTENGSVSVSIKWMEIKSFGEKCFEPIPYDDEGIFEKEENFYMISMKSQQGVSEEYLILNKQKKEFCLEDVEYSNDPSDGVLKIIIKDTGCGMSEEGLQRLFQKFSQVSSDPHKRQIGTGLGLFITREICRKMGGDVRAYSKPGCGSTFIVCIPTSSISTCSQLRLNINSQVVLKRLSERKLKTIVADDSPFNVSLISKFFNKIDAQVIATAHDGYNACKKYIDAREARIIVDVVTLDIDMPKMDGKEAYQKIREYERLKGKNPTIIILISGNYSEYQILNLLGKPTERRANYFLAKPIIFEEFCSVIYNLTKIRSDTDSSSH